MTLKDAFEMPKLFAASPTETDSILLPIPDCEFVLTGDDVKSKNARTDSHELTYEFCFPITTKQDSENVKQSLGQFYSQLIDITEEKGIQMEVVNSRGVALTNCIWSLVLSNIACLGRVVTLTKGNKVKNVGYCIASGESGWVMSSIHFAFHAWNVKLHQLSPLKPYLRWHVLDRGAGNMSGMKKFYPVLIMIQLMTVNLRVVTQSQVIPNATGVTIQS